MKTEEIQRMLKFRVHDGEPEYLNYLDVKRNNYEIGKESDIIKALGIGPCLAITLYDSETKTGALAHINKYSYTTDSKLIPDLILWSLFSDMNVKNMSNLEASLSGESEIEKEYRISDIIREQLQQLKIPIIGEDLGDVKKGRIVCLDCYSGNVDVYRPMR